MAKVLLILVVISVLITFIGFAICEETSSKNERWKKNQTNILEEGVLQTTEPTFVLNLINDYNICLKNDDSQYYGYHYQVIDYFLSRIERKESYISSLKTSLKNANDEKLKCELEKEVTTTRIILTSSSEISPENQFTQSNGCQDFIRKIDGLSRHIQQREADNEHFKEFFLKHLLDCSNPIEYKNNLVSPSVRIFKPALTTPTIVPDCPEKQVYGSGSCRDLIKRTNSLLLSMLQPILTTKHPNLKSD